MIPHALVRTLKGGAGKGGHHDLVPDATSPPTPDPRYIRSLQSLSLRDLPQVGGKAASIGELHRACGTIGVRVPTGFALTADAYRETVTQAGVQSALDRLLDRLEVADLIAFLSSDRAGFITGECIAIDGARQCLGAR